MAEEKKERVTVECYLPNRWRELSYREASTNTQQGGHEGGEAREEDTGEREREREVTKRRKV